MDPSNGPQRSPRCLLVLRPFHRLWFGALRAYQNIRSVRWLLLGIVAGCMSGSAAILFFLGVEGLRHLFLNTLAGLVLPAPAGERLFHGASGTPRPWLIPVFTTLVGLLTGYLVSRFISPRPNSGTDGTDTMIKAFHYQGGLIRLRSALIKSSTAVLTIASGGSAGREGPISLLGAGMGSFLATRLGLSAKERRILLLAGAAGGLGAIFRAPLGGALTAVEVIYREDFEAEAILPSVISSVVAYTLFTLVYGTEPLFGIPRFSFSDARELPFYILLSLVCAAAGWFYVKTFFFIKFNVFNRILDRVGLIWTTALGGLVMGLVGMMFPELLSGGYGWLELAILGKLSIFAMLGILVGKTIATSITLGSGMSGGMFAPALFVGGMSGGVVGFMANHYYPHIVTQPGGYVLVGMASFFAGVANAPIGPLIMVCELTQGYGLLAPLMLASALCLVLNRNISLYENQVDSKFDSPAHIDDATINILENLKVESFYKPGRVTTLEEGTSFGAMTDIIANSNEFYFPVRDHGDDITGIVAVQDLRKVLYEDGLRDLLVAKDVAKRAVLLVPDDDLYTALLKFVDTDYGQIPVVDPGDPRQILGLLSREDVFKAYAQTLKSLKEE
ncbi:MAG: chloride channel protein [Desulfovibrionales bacterium]